MNHAEFYKYLPAQPGYQKKYAEMLKETLVYEYSDKKTQSLKELAERWPRKYDRMINDMRDTYQKHLPKTDAERKLLLKQKRSEVLKLLTLIGVDTAATAKGDWNPVNDYLSSPKISGKTLNMMTIEELEKCKARLLAIRHKNLKSMN